MKRTLIKGLEAVADLLLPRQCIVCGERLYLDERHLCLHCLADLPLTHFWNMTHNPMADRFNLLIQNGKDAEQDSVGPEGYAFCAALFFYDSDSGYAQITRRLKYRHDIEAGRHFGGMLGNRLASAPHFRDVDTIIPVPLHASRKWERGYNQAEIIAAELAGHLGADMRNDILIRHRKTLTQTKLSIEEKSRNVDGAFSVRTDGLRLHGIRHILLTDDIFTTGATLYSCFKTLRKSLPPSVRISAATLGFVGH